ncbi:MAG TPA: oxidoreductase [Bacteroidota bacterium]|nr:oxidoreductase [Bacteroidota bacterium]
MTPRTALLFGASGLVGRQCLNELLAKDAYSDVHLFLRNPIPITHAKLKQHIINFDQLPEYAALIKGDDLFCCLGTTMRKAGSQEAFEKVDYGYPLQIAQLASANDVGQYLLVTSIGADPSSSNFYLRTKGKVEEAVKFIPFHAVLIFRPSFLLGSRQESRFGERIGIMAVRALTAAPVSPLKKYRPIAASAVARAMVRQALANLTGIHIFESDEIQTLGAA